MESKIPLEKLLGFIEDDKRGKLVEAITRRQPTGLLTPAFIEDAVSY